MVILTHYITPGEECDLSSLIERKTQSLEVIEGKNYENYFRIDH
jgi:hypothetical protein